MTIITVDNEIQTIWGSAHHGALLLKSVCSDYKTSISNQNKYIWYKNINNEWIIIKNIDFEINTFRERLTHILSNESETINSPHDNEPDFNRKMEGFILKKREYNKFIEKIYNRTFIKSICKELESLLSGS